MSADRYALARRSDGRVKVDASSNAGSTRKNITSINGDISMRQNEESVPKGARRGRSITVEALCVSLALSWAVTVSAQGSPQSAANTDAGELEELVVTSARLRDESAQEAPIAVSVVDSAFIQSLQGSNTSALSAVIPNLVLYEQTFVPGVASTSIRGFSNLSSDISAEPGLAVYVDGIYQTMTTGSLTDLYDVDRIEVVRGPQSTLLGKNAAAGAILVTRARPKNEFSGRAQVEYGSEDLIQAQGLVNFPIIADRLSGKLFASYRQRDEWVRNLSPGEPDLNGEKRGSVRAALLFHPDEDFEAYLSADYIWDRSDMGGLRNVSDTGAASCQFFGVCGPHRGMRRVTAAGFTDKPFIDDVNVTANIRWARGPVSLSSLTGYKRYKTENNADLDGTELPILEVFDSDTDYDQFSQELRLSSVQDGGLDLGGRLSWLVAAYFGQSDGTMTQGLMAFGSPLQQEQTSKRESEAVFAQADLKIHPQWTLTGGIRRSWDETKHRYSLPVPGTVPASPDIPESKKFSNTSVEGGVRFQVTDTKMLYFRYAEGYRGGGFIGLPTTPGLGGYDPETSKSYEIGAKTDWLDNRVRLNLTLFDVKFNDLQRNTTIVGPDQTFSQAVRNAASATTRGVELESVFAVAKPLTVRVNVGYLDAFYRDYHIVDETGSVVDLSGREFSWSPEWTGTVDVDYAVDFGGVAPLGFDSGRINARAVTQSAVILSNEPNPAGEQGGFTTYDLTLRANNPAGYEVSVYGKNLTDKDFIINGNDVSGLTQFQADNMGRTFGIALSVSF